MEKLSTKVNNDRNHGIDLLRVVAMFFVVVLHSLGHGGVLGNAITGSGQYQFAWFLEIFAYCAVDIFALISGYVSYTTKEKDVNYANYINLWLQVVFYGVIIGLVLNIINPSFVIKSDFLNALFPVTKQLYWYFTAYTGLFVVMPIINKGIRNCNDGTLKKIFIAIFGLFTFFEILSPKFILNSGYSFIWITLLYILGAILKKTQIGKKIIKTKLVVAIIILSIVTYLYKMYGLEISKFGIIITRDIFVSYTSPTVLGMAILYVLYFSKIRFNNIFVRIIEFMAPSTFAIYLINDNGLVRRNIIINLFSGLIDNTLIEIFITIIGFSLVFVICSILIDKIRIFLFKICRIKEISNKIVYLVDKLLDRLVDLL